MDPLASSSSTMLRMEKTDLAARWVADDAEAEGVGVDDFAIELKGEVEGRRGFSGGGWADDVEGLRRWDGRRHLGRRGKRKARHTWGVTGFWKVVSGWEGINPRRSR